MNAAPGDSLGPFYRQRIAEHGLGYQAMWGDNAAWKSAERFRPLAMLPIEPGDVLVDIGCGTGNLAQTLKDTGIDCEYVGVEAVPEFAAAARAATSAPILELDAFRDLDALPPADWYVTFGTVNKSWNVADLPGNGDVDRVHGLFRTLFSKARKGVAATVVTDVVDHRKPGVINMDPAAVAATLKQLTPHFTVFHGYPFYEFFAAAWRARRV